MGRGRASGIVGIARAPSRPLGRMPCSRASQRRPCRFIWPPRSRWLCHAGARRLPQRSAPGQRAPGRSFGLGALRGRSARAPLCLSRLRIAPLRSSAGNGTRRCFARRQSAAMRPRSTTSHSGRAGRRGAQGRHSSQNLSGRPSASIVRGGTQRVPLPNPRRGHAHSLRRLPWQPWPRGFHTEGGVGQLRGNW
jgi:hypothetical protein